MAELFEGNQFPRVLFRADVDPIHVYDKEQLAQAKLQGYLESNPMKEYPKHVTTGATRKDAGGNMVPVTVIVKNRAEEDAVIGTRTGDKPRQPVAAELTGAAQSGKGSESSATK